MIGIGVQIHSNETKKAGKAARGEGFSTWSRAYMNTVLLLMVYGTMIIAPQNGGQMSSAASTVLFGYSGSDLTALCA
jgi:hypothetical protein